MGQQQVWLEVGIRKAMTKASSGRHRIVAKKSGHNRKWAKVVNLSAGPNPEIRVKFQAAILRGRSLAREGSESVKESTGRLQIYSVPPRPRAKIYINGRAVGKTPYEVVLPAGTHKCRIKRKRVSLTDKVDVLANVVGKIEADFQKRKIIDVGAEQRRAVAAKQAKAAAQAAKRTAFNEMSTAIALGKKQMAAFNRCIEGTTQITSEDKDTIDSQGRIVVTVRWVKRHHTGRLDWWTRKCVKPHAPFITLPPRPAP